MSERKFGEITSENEVVSEVKVEAVDTSEEREISGSHRFNPLRIITETALSVRTGHPKIDLAKEVAQEILGVDDNELLTMLIPPLLGIKKARERARQKKEEKKLRNIRR